MGLSDAQRNTLRALGFVVDNETSADATLGLAVVTLHDTRGRSTSSAMRALREAAPDATFTYQHIYLPAGDSARDEASTVEPYRADTRSVGLFDTSVGPAGPRLVSAHNGQTCRATEARSRPGTASAGGCLGGEGR